MRTSQELKEYCVKTKKENCVLPYKGGIAVIIGGVAKEIFIGKGATTNARKRFKELQGKK